MFSASAISSMVAKLPVSSSLRHRKPRARALLQVSSEQWAARPMSLNGLVHQLVSLKRLRSVLQEIAFLVERSPALRSLSGMNYEIVGKPGFYLFVTRCSEDLVFTFR